MSWDKRIGLAGVTLGLIGIAVFYIWPNQKAIGRVSLWAACALLIAWILMEAYHYIGNGAVVINWLVAFDWQSSLLCIRNYEPAPFFDVVIKIPQDGSALESSPLPNLQGNGEISCFSITKREAGDAVAIAMLADNLLWSVRDSGGMIRKGAVSMRISYTDQTGKRKDYDGFEITLPFKDSSIRRRIRLPIFRRLGFRSQ